MLDSMVIEKPKLVDESKSIILICAYMGPLPFWFPAFLLSCRRNSSIQWILISNDSRELSLPDNVSLLHMNLDEFNHRVSNKLNIEVCVEEKFAYKINDLKVTFGHVFAEEIKGYSFWGYCDLDIIWGNIREFLTDTILEEFDIITSRVCRVSGHFCVFRNNDSINKLYLSIPNFHKMVITKNNFAIDEEHITNFLLMIVNPTWIVRLKNLFKQQSLVRPRIYWNRVLTTSGAHQRTLGLGTERAFLWDRGRTYDADGNELMYIHFHKIKQTMKALDFSIEDNPEKFSINREGMYSVK